MQDVKDQIDATGASVVAISPITAEKSQEMVDKHSLGFDVLSDAGNNYAAALGIRFEVPADVKEIYSGFGLDLPAFNGDDSWTLPMPARLVVGQDGVVTAADVDPNYTARPEPEKTVADLKALG